MLQPHLDDLPFSIGHLLRRKEWVPAVYRMWTIFGKEFFNIRGYPHDLNTESILAEEERLWSRQSGYQLNRLSLGEAGYRGVNSIRRLFLTSRCHESELDYEAMGYGNWQEVLGSIRSLIQPDVSSIWVPAGIGGHCDHLAVRQAVINLALQSNVCVILFYHELPYSQYSKIIDWSSFSVRGFKHIGLISCKPSKLEAAEKQRNISVFHSQINERQSMTLARETECVSVWLREVEV